MKGNVYGVTFRLKAFIAFITTSLTTALVGLFVIPFISIPANSFASKLYNTCCSSNYLFYLTPLLIMAVIVFGIIMIIAVFSKKIIFTDGAVISKNVFATHKLAYSEIKGFRITGFVLHLEANSDKKRISINLFSLNRADKLIHNLENRFQNLDFLQPETTF